MGLIEAGRKLIVNAIKGLGQVLKGFVKIAFAKFSGIANKICSRIDNAVKAVNIIADGLSSYESPQFYAVKVNSLHSGDFFYTFKILMIDIF